MASGESFLGTIPQGQLQGPETGTFGLIVGTIGIEVQGRGVDLAVARLLSGRKTNGPGSYILEDFHCLC